MFGTGTAAIVSPVGNILYKDKKVYDRAFYTSKTAQKRYEIVKDVKTEDQFFKFVEDNPLT